MFTVTNEATFSIRRPGGRPTSLLLVHREDGRFPRGRGGTRWQREGGADQGAPNRALIRVLSSSVDGGRHDVFRLHDKLRAVRLFRRAITFAHQLSTRSLE